MKPIVKVAGLLFFAMATAVLAHSGVKNPSVKARMDSMGTIGKETGVLGAMAKGETAFDAPRARAAAQAIATHSAQISELFRNKETDPKSEALPEIWLTFGDFTAKAKALETAALKAAGDIRSEADLPPALANIGRTCSACHKLYRQKK